MDKNKLESVIDALIISTDSGETVWSIKPSIFDSETSKKLSAKIDEKTTIEINIECDEVGRVKPNGIITISSKEITGGFKSIHDNKVKKLQEQLFLKHTGLVGPDKTDIVLDNILNKIGKVGIRDNKIETLLNKKEIEENKSKNIFSRIFKL